jgi:hypothetical protein
MWKGDILRFRTCCKKEKLVLCDAVNGYVKQTASYVGIAGFLDVVRRPVF